MKDILWISCYAPYDSVSHAGGKIHNYWLKQFHKEQDFRIHLISFCNLDEVNRLDLDAYEIRNDIYVIGENVFKATKEKIQNLFALPILLSRYAGFISAHRILHVKKKIEELKQKDYKPDVIILQWTQIVLLEPLVRKAFPECKIVSIEEDVTFLKTEREFLRAQGIVKRFLRGMQHRIMKKQELGALKASDLIVLNNYKDQGLLVKSGIDFSKAICVTPFYNNMKEVKREIVGKDILFFGAMNRPENVEAAVWFINNVFGDLLKSDPGFRFIVLGAYPPKTLQCLSNEQIIVTGFVEDPQAYFGSCFCLVSPLQMGAGIKIKVLESFSAGVPVLTNAIGIEGIPAEDGIEYFHCETSKQYLDKILFLRDHPEISDKIGANARLLIKEKFDFPEKSKEFIDRIKNLG